MGADRGGAALSKLRLLGVVGAKLRAEVLPGGRAPDFNVAIAGTERLAAEHAAARAAAHEIPAAREHRNLPSHWAYLDRASRFVNARLTWPRIDALASAGASKSGKPDLPLSARKSGKPDLRVRMRAIPLIPVRGQPRRMWQINHTPTKSRYPHEFGRHRAMVSTPSTGRTSVGGVRNVFHQQLLACGQRRTSLWLRPAQGFILGHGGSAAVARRGADRGGARGLRAAAAAHDEQRQPSGRAGGSPQGGRPAPHAGGERAADGQHKRRRLWACELLQLRPAHRERREVRQERIDRRPPHAAVRHAAARHRRRYRTLGNGARQRPRPVRSRPRGRRLGVRRRDAGHHRQRRREGQGRRRRSWRKIAFLRREPALTSRRPPPKRWASPAKAWPRSRSTSSSSAREAAWLCPNTRAWTHKSQWSGNRRLMSARARMRLADRGGCLESANTAARSLTPPRPYGVKFIRCASLRSTHPTRPRLRRHAAAERYRHAQCAVLPGSSRQAVACGLNSGLRGQSSGTIPQCLNLQREFNHTASKPCILGL